MPVIDLIAGQHLQGAASYTTTDIYESGQYRFNATTDGYSDGISLKEVAMLLTGLPPEISTAEILSLTFAGSVEGVSGSVGEVGVPFVANSQLYDRQNFGLGGFGGFEVSNEPLEAGFVNLVDHPNGTVQPFPEFTVNTANVSLAYDDLTTGAVWVVGFPTSGFTFGTGFDFNLRLSTATLEVVGAAAPLDFWTGFNLTREEPL